MLGIDRRYDEGNKMIRHNPKFDTKKIEELYSKKDGVPVKYVCTTALDTFGTNAVDVFYRETPHPEFGNRYFGIYKDLDSRVMITNADRVENLTFETVKVADQYHYSQHRHDFRTISDVSIDGGRAYLRLVGNFKDIERKTFKIKDGVFVDVS